MRRSVRIAAVLWIVLGVVVWNEVFDAHVNTAANRYIHEATLAFRGEAPPVTMDGIMRPAIARGLWSASAWAALIVVGGLAAVFVGARRTTRPQSPAEASAGRAGPAGNRA